LIGLVGVGLLISIVKIPAAASDPIVTEGVVNASIADVWKMFTTKEGMESWMVAKTDIDLRAGGSWRTSYSKESNLDDDSSVHHTILAYDPQRMFSFRTVKAPKNFPFPGAILRTWTVVYFEPDGESRTKVIIRMIGFAEDDESQRMRRFFEAGNKSTLDALMKKFR
jgi:uncharacterized protein YndB with AHSA1/START domain